MRKTTRRKYYGQIYISQSLSVALNSVDKAIEEASKPVQSPLSLALAKAGKELLDAAKACETYGMDRKRLVSALQHEREHIATLLDQVRAIPVTPEEKALAKHRKNSLVK